MGPKKAALRPVNYVKSSHSSDRDLKGWYAQHKEYYASFKEKIENLLINNDPKVLDIITDAFSKFPGFEPKKAKKLFGEDLMNNPPKRFKDYNWDKKKDVVNWVTNDLDATIAEHLSPLAPENIPAWRKLFVEDGLNDNTYAMLYWIRHDDGQLKMLMALSRSMEQENITGSQMKAGEFLIKSVVEKGVTTGCFHKNYWEKIFSMKGLFSLKQRIANALSITKGKGGRNANIYLLREIITGPDKHAILRNIEGVINTRKKDTDLACLLMLLVRTGNVDKDIKYKPFHDAIKSEFPDAGIGTERRPQQLYNNLAVNPQQLLTANTWKRCERRIDELREQLEIA